MTVAVIISLASPTDTAAALCLKHSSGSVLRRHMGPCNFNSPSPDSTTTTATTVLARQLVWAIRDRDGVRYSVLRRYSAVLRNLRSPYRFRTAAVSPAAGGTILQDVGAAAIVMAGAYGLVFTCDSLTQRNLMDQRLSRKVVHILSGLLFMACWPIFSTSAGARYFASLVPLANCFRLVTHGLLLATDEGLIKSVTREGKPEELLRGPLYYVLVLILCGVVFWRDSPIGLVSLAMMCGGDGIADIMGRSFGSLKLPYNKNKSWAGSISMFVFGFLTSIGMLYYYSALGYFQLNWFWTVERVALVSFVATVVESLPTAGIVDDNISVPLASMVTAYLTFAV